jgi:hypothetical protein
MFVMEEGNIGKFVGAVKLGGGGDVETVET